MGDCSSRPPADKVQSHINTSSSRHDSKFYPEPDLPNYLDTLNFEKSKDPVVQQEQRSLLAKLQIDISRLMAVVGAHNKQSDYGTRSVVLVEVQKGADLYFDQLCLQEPKPIVEVIVEPYGDKLETFSGEPVLPSWFTFLCLGVHPSSEKIVFKVVCERNFGARVELGRFEETLEVLRDGKVRDDWYTLSSKKKFNEGETPRLKLRFQFISNMAQLMAKRAQICEAALTRILSAYERLKSVVEAFSA